MTRLNEAAQRGDIEDLHRILEEDPRILSQIDDLPFADTPLHVASCHGNAKFAVEVTVFQPSFTRKLNPKGLSPMHEALKARKWETARVLVQLDTELIRVKGSGGETPLHVAAEVAPPELLAELLFVCPSSIKDVTAGWETAVHRAVKKNNVANLQVLIGWIISVDKGHVLQWKDIDGNTVLHLAARARSKEMVEMLVKYVSIDRTNFNGENASDYMVAVGVDRRDEEIRLLLAAHKSDRSRLLRPLLITLSARYSSLGKFYGSGKGNYSFRRLMGFRPMVDSDEKSRDVVLLVAVLIATTTYQAMLTPPGGYWQDSSSSKTRGEGFAPESASGYGAGQMIISGMNRFGFVSMNTLAFCFSVAVILVNVIQLKQALMLITATCILLFNYFITLVLTWSWNHTFKISQWNIKFRPEAVIPSIATAIGFLYIVLSVLATSDFKFLTDTPDSDIRILVQRDQPESEYGGCGDDDDP